MTEETQEIETVDVEQTYTSAMHSVDLINRMYEAGETTSEEDLDTIKRNKDHLELMLGKDFWTEAQDLAPFRAAVAR
jgi:hypothetical protein